jgi:hypothetical protein
VGAHVGGQCIRAHSPGGSCSPPLSLVPISSDDEDNSSALDLTNGDFAEEAMVIELADLVVN